MYEKLIQPPPLSNKPKNLAVRLPAFPVPEKAVYVDFVCGVLIDGRFGLGRSTPLVIKLDEMPEREEAVFFEMTDAGPVPSYVVLPDSEMARRDAEYIIRHELARLRLSAAEANVQTRSPATQGRGSP